MLIASPSSNRIQAAIAACLLLATVSFSTPVFADDVQGRLRTLEGSVDTLNRAVFKGETPAVAPSSSAASSDYQASVETRLGALEKQVRELTGKVEQQEFETNQMKTKLDKALTDIDLRFQDVSKGGSAAPAIGTAPSASSSRQSGTLAPNDMGGDVSSASASPAAAPLTNPLDAASSAAVTDPNAPASQSSPTVQNLGTMNEAPGGATIPPKAGDDPAGQYEMAFSLLKGGNYGSAKNGFETFLKSYPDHPLVSNATYWLGECYYAQGEYDKAARIFAESYKKYPKGPKVSDSLLKMGMSLGASGKKKEGCVVLQQLKKEFASGDAVVLRRADQEMSRLACGS